MTPRKIVERYLEVRPLLETLEALGALCEDDLQKLIGYVEAPPNCGLKRYIRILKHGV
jgi:hypothetical protein